MSNDECLSRELGIREDHTFTALLIYKFLITSFE